MQIKNLLDVCEINDKSVGGFEGIKNYVATGDVDYDKIISFDEVNYEDKPSRANRGVEIGDILVAKMKETVKVAKITEENYGKYIFSTGFSTLKAKEDKLNIDYLYYVLISDYFQKQKDKYSKGATQKAINNTGLKKIKIPVPPIKIQKKIVKILDQAQSLIDNRREQIKLLDNLIESIFYDMFGDPVRNNKDWKISELGSFIEHMNNGMSRRGKDEDGGIVLRLVELQSKFIDYENINRINLSDDEKVRYELKDKDILFARVNGNPDYVGRSAVYDADESKPVYFNDHLIRVTLSYKELNPIYLVNLLNSRFGLSIFKEHIKTSAGQYTINQEGIKKLEFIIPPIELQNEFTEKVEQIESQKQLLEDSLKLLEDNYNNLMQRAFKGQLFKRR